MISTNADPRMHGWNWTLQAPALITRGRARRSECFFFSPSSILIFRFACICYPSIYIYIFRCCCIFWLAHFLSTTSLKVSPCIDSKLFYLQLETKKNEIELDLNNNLRKRLLSLQEVCLCWARATLHIRYGLLLILSVSGKRRARSHTAGNAPVIEACRACVYYIFHWEQ